MAIIEDGVFVETVAGTSHTTGTIVTLPTGVNRKLVVLFASESSGAVSALAFDGTSFVANAVSSILSDDDNQVRAYSFYYDIPDAKAASDYAITWTSGTSSANWTCYWYILGDAATGAPEDADTAEWGTEATNATITLTCTDGAVMLGVAITGAASQTWTVTGTGVAEDTDPAEQNETNYTSVPAFGAISGAGDKTFIATVSSAATGNKAMLALSVAALLGPTITTQPSAATAVVAGPLQTTAVFTVDCAAAITSCPWELEDSVGAGTYSTITSGVGGFVIQNTLGDGTSVLTYTPSATTHTGKKVRAKPADAGGTTTSTAVVMTVKAGAVFTGMSTTTGANGAPAAAGAFTTDDSRANKSRTGFLLQATYNGVTYDIGYRTVKGNAP
jgi:hypothetical protein